MMLFRRLLLSAAYCVLGSATVLKNPVAANDIEKRTGTCDSPAIVFIDDVFKHYAQTASQICSTILHRSAKPTKTVTSTSRAGATVSTGTQTVLVLQTATSPTISVTTVVSTALSTSVVTTVVATSTDVSTSVTQTTAEVFT